MFNVHNMNAKQIAIAATAIVATLILSGVANKHRTGKVLALRETAQHERDRLEKYRDGVDLRIATLDLRIAQAQANELKASAEAAQLEFKHMAEAQQRAEQLAEQAARAIARVEELKEIVTSLTPKAAAAPPKVTHAEGEGSREEVEKTPLVRGRRTAEDEGTPLTRHDDVSIVIDRSAMTRSSSVDSAASDK